MEVRAGVLNLAKYVPSNTAAIVAGAVVMPLSAMVAKWLSGRTDNNILLVGWGFIGFIVPVVVATTELKELRRPFHKMFAFREFYFPSWKRGLLAFASFGVSYGLLVFLGLVP